MNSMLHWNKFSFVFFVLANMSLDRRIVLNVTYFNKNQSDYVLYENSPIFVSHECYKYLFISRAFASTNEVCYMELMNTFCVPTLVPNKKTTVVEYINKIFPEMLELTRKSLLGFIVRNGEHFQHHIEYFSETFIEMTSELKPCDFMNQNKLLEFMDSIQTFISVTNKMANTIIFEGLKVVWSFVKNKDSLLITKYMLTCGGRNVFISENHENVIPPIEDFIHFQNLSQYNINTYLNNKAFERYYFVCCEINVTCYIIELIFLHMKNIKACCPKTQNDVIFALNSKNFNVFHLKITNHFIKLISKINKFLLSYNTQISVSKHHFKSMIIVFDDLQVLHYLKRYYNLGKKSLIELRIILDTICGIINKSRTVFTGEVCTKNKKLANAREPLFKLEKLYSWHHDHFKTLRNSIYAYKMIVLSPRYEYLMNIIAAVTNDAINLVNIEEVNYFTMKSQNISCKVLIRTFEDRLASIKSEVHSKVLELTDQEYELIWLAFVSLQRNLQINYLLRLNYQSLYLQNNDTNAVGMEQANNLLKLQGLMRYTNLNMDDWRNLCLIEHRKKRGYLPQPLNFHGNGIV